MHSKDLQTPFSDYFDVLKRRWIYLLTVLPLSLALAVYLAFTLPPMYKATGTLLLEQPPVPEDLVRTTVTSYAGQQIELVQRQVMTVDNLENLVHTEDPYPNETELDARAKARKIRQNTVIERVDPVTLEPLAESPAFSVNYFNPDPIIAARIARRLTDLFLSLNRQARTAQARETYRFLQQRSTAIERQVKSLEQELADFKQEYGDAIPEAQGRNEAALERLGRDLDSLQSQLRLADERRELLELQLRRTSPYLDDSLGDWQAELVELRAQLAESQLIYSDDHPDIRRLRRAIRELNDRRGSLEGPGAENPDNPEYLAVQNQLQTVTEEVDAINRAIDEARRETYEYESRLRMAPDVERQYRQITRELQIASNQYIDIQGKLSEAFLAQALESENQGARLTLIVEPYVPDSPDRPNRVGIILLGIVVGGVFAAGAAALTDSMDPRLRGPKDLIEISEIVPIGTIPHISNERDIMERFIWISCSLTVLALTLLLVGSTVYTRLT